MNKINVQLPQSKSHLDLHCLTRNYPPPLEFCSLTKTMTVIHVVLFQFKADAKPEDVKAVRTAADASFSILIRLRAYATF